MIIAGTGHRPDKLGGYSPHTNKKVLAFATKTLEYHKPSLVLSGMALGWDSALAQASINLNIPFHAYVPFIGQEQVWPSATKLYYKALLARAEKVIICSTGGYSSAAMQFRNQRMVDSCELLLALWNGSRGGTANCISYAIFAGKPYTNYWPQFIMDADGEAPFTPAIDDWLRS